MLFRSIQSALCAPRAGGRVNACFIAVAGRDLDWLVQYYAKRGIAVEPRCIDQIGTDAAEPAFGVYELARK